MKKFLALALISIAVAVGIGLPMAAHSHSLPPMPESTSEALSISDVNWEQLNPARGDQSPQAGTLWGDRTGPGPSGFLLKPVDGFRSPPHIHNTAYRGVVIDGTIHNDDPDAEDMYMPVGSFWTQPAGEVHITAAQGDDALAYIEVEDEFGVLPAEEAFDDGDSPVNVDASNIVWLDASNTDWIEPPSVSNQSSAPNGINDAEIAFLWGTPQDGKLNGTLVKLPAKFSGTIRSEGSALRAVVIKGQPQYRTPNKTSLQALGPGSYFSSTGKSVHQVSSDAEEESIIYVRSEGQFAIFPT
ncbi:MAG: DUF4437 domain-containing protein [Cyanobacteria bacterium P01_F01_bin.153]